MLVIVSRGVFEIVEKNISQENLSSLNFRYKLTSCQKLRAMKWQIYQFQHFCRFLDVKSYLITAIWQVSEVNWLDNFVPFPWNCHVKSTIRLFFTQWSFQLAEDVMSKRSIYFINLKWTNEVKFLIKLVTHPESCKTEKIIVRLL